eukprot:CAMPEP_0170481530 /NCGR_PEP_ID=MMETSP0208-20121228/1942_1 /TAXON_ID=197538 /ORGANISM="Strombidium inclinatum, Strain S3" /LENGTH=301 /DNA_ID=CAMNT_0010754251 /DNA_START=8 /DNA_END=910 /DNA_ORIENTATION=+
MKAVIALLISTTSAIQLRGITYVPEEDIFIQRRITDEDGDGVEDNVKKTQNELDKFRQMVYGSEVEDLHNTHNGEVAGHVRHGEDPVPAFTRRKLKDIQKVSLDELSWNFSDSQPEEEAKKAAFTAPEEEPKKAGFTAPEEEAKKTAFTEPEKKEKNSLAEPVKEAPKDTFMSVEAENFAESAESSTERSWNEYDSEYLQTRLSNLVNRIDSPEALEDAVMVQTTWKRGANRIYDKDGDGVEDNKFKSADDLDAFYLPAVFGDAEDLHNTHHGNLPGHVQHEFDVMEVEPIDHYSLTKEDW